MADIHAGAAAAVNTDASEGGDDGGNDGGDDLMKRLLKRSKASR